jgi:hypothetical protein
LGEGLVLEASSLGDLLPERGAGVFEVMVRRLAEFRLGGALCRSSENEIGESGVVCLCISDGEEVLAAWQLGRALERQLIRDPVLQAAGKCNSIAPPQLRRSDGRRAWLRALIGPRRRGTGCDYS